MYDTMKDEEEHEHTKFDLGTHSDEGVTLKTSASESFFHRRA